VGAYVSKYPGRAHASSRAALFVYWAGKRRRNGDYVFHANKTIENKGGLDGQGILTISTDMELNSSKTA
jgi:hypothetical protein